MTVLLLHFLFAWLELRSASGWNPGSPLTSSSTVHFSWWGHPKSQIKWALSSFFLWGFPAYWVALPFQNSRPGWHPQPVSPSSSRLSWSEANLPPPSTALLRSHLRFPGTKLPLTSPLFTLIYCHSGAQITFLKYFHHITSLLWSWQRLSTALRSNLNSEVLLKPLGNFSPLVPNGLSLCYTLPRQVCLLHLG